jgi:hypothetical protein
MTYGNWDRRADQRLTNGNGSMTPTIHSLIAWRPRNSP